jgi:hypothetical protein
MKRTAIPATIDEYIAACPAEVRPMNQNDVGGRDDALHDLAGSDRGLGNQCLGL